MRRLPSEPEVVGTTETLSVQRSLWLLVGGLIIFLLGAGVLVASLIRQNEQDPSFSGTQAAGPALGVDIAVYAAERHATILEDQEAGAAIISFTKYLLDTDAPAALNGLAIRRYLVVAPGGKPAVTDDVAAWRKDQRVAAERERKEITDIIPTVGDPEYLKQYQADLQLWNRMIQELDRGVGVVFGVVAEGNRDQIIKTVAHPTVRLVDVIDPEAIGTRELHGAFPEEKVAGQPPARP